MSPLALLLIVSAALVGDSAEAAWCICRSGMPPTAYQAALDYACGRGADCSSILQNGACYLPNTELTHCSYAVNSYFQRNGQASGSCDFSGVAAVAATDPSYPGCSYPSAYSTAGNGTPPGWSAAGSTSIGPKSSTDGNGAGRHVMAAAASLSLAIILPGLAPAGA